MTDSARIARFLPVVILCAIGIAAAGLPFLHVAPNRLLSGVPQNPDPIALLVAWLLVAVAGCSRFRWLATACTAAMVITLPWLAGHDATQLLEGASSTTRIQTGAGFWTMWLAALLLLLDRVRGLRIAWQAGIWGVWRLSSSLAAWPALSITLPSCVSITRSVVPFSMPCRLIWCCR